MALLAEAGHLDPEQGDEVRAVGLVTVQAALQDRRMLPEPWASLGGMAARAELIDGHRRDQLFGRRPVRVVTARTGHPPAVPSCRQGHVGRPLELHGPYLVALAAQVILHLVQELSLRVVLVYLDDLQQALLGPRMNRVAGRAGDIPGLVLASLPENLPSPRMALETDSILVYRRQGGCLAKAEVERRVPRILDVLAPRAVAPLAAASLKVALGQLRPQEPAVEGVLHLRGNILVAPLALLAADVRRPGDSGHGGLSPGPHKQGQDSQGADRARQGPGPS